MLARRRTPRRRGMTVVETALVLGVFLMLLFGIFEYCRYLLVLHVTSNAARDGARYATVNVNKDATVFGKTDIVNYTRAKMGGVDKQLGGFAVDVYPCDATGVQKVSDASHPGAYVWNEASFTETIAVKITGTYVPLLPSFLSMPTTIPVTIVAKMGSEG